MLILYLVGIVFLMMCFFIGFWLETGCPIAMTLTNLWKLPAGRGTRRIFGFDGGPVPVSLGGSLVPNGIRHGHVQAGNFREWEICHIFYECVSHFLCHVDTITYWLLTFLGHDRFEANMQTMNYKYIFTYYIVATIVSYVMWNYLHESSWCHVGLT